MANADSATNMLWLINQATAGELTSGKVPVAEQPRTGGADEKKESPQSPGGDTSFSEIKIDMTA